MAECVTIRSPGDNRNNEDEVNRGGVSAVTDSYGGMPAPVRYKKGRSRADRHSETSDTHGRSASN